MRVITLYNWKDPRYSGHVDIPIGSHQVHQAQQSPSHHLLRQMRSGNPNRADHDPDVIHKRHSGDGCGPAAPEILGPARHKPQGFAAVTPFAIGLLYSKRGGLPEDAAIRMSIISRSAVVDRDLPNVFWLGQFPAKSFDHVRRLAAVLVWGRNFAGRILSSAPESAVNEECREPLHEPFDFVSPTLSGARLGRFGLETCSSSRE